MSENRGGGDFLTHTVRTLSPSLIPDI